MHYNEKEDNIEASCHNPDPVETPVVCADAAAMEKYVGKTPWENNQAIE